MPETRAYTLAEMDDMRETLKFFWHPGGGKDSDYIEARLREEMEMGLSPVELLKKYRDECG